jgi:beta-hydroxylase
MRSPFVQLSLTKLTLLGLFVAAAAYVHQRGRVRHRFWRQVTDHSTFLAPINALLYLTSRVPNAPYIDVSAFPELKPLQDNWSTIRDEALALESRIRASDTYNDAGFNSFFRTGWKRFYLFWYGVSHPSAEQCCPRTVELLRGIPGVKAAMFAELPPGGKLVRHRDPYAGSIRYHLGLSTPGSDACFIEVDGQRHSWRDGEPVMFDETFIHYAENRSDKSRLILFCDVERPLRFHWATAFNRWFSRHVMSAVASPNDAGDSTGGINRLFAHAYKVRLRAKALKKRNRALYYVLKWLLFGGLALLILMI